MTHPTLQFVAPDECYGKSFLAGYEEMTTPSDRDAWIYLGPDGTEDLIYNRFSEYVAELRSRETTPAPHFVRGITYWAIQGEELVGRIGLRLELNDFLATLGGHVGYIVRPSCRGRGIASRMLEFVLQTSEARSLGKLLVTCDEDNLASQRVIEKCGGVYESTLHPDGRPVGKRRYWILAT